MIDLTHKKLLVIAPHPDDEVIGCAGLIRKIKAAAGKVYVIFLTVAASQDFSSKGRSSQRERTQEIKKVAQFLKIDDWRIAFPGSRYHLQLDQVAQKKIIHEIERGKKISLETIKPDIITFPDVNDYNQDHRAAATATITACRPAPTIEKFLPPLILSYEAPMTAWSINAPANPNFFIGLSAQDTQTKMKAMELYASQVRLPGHPRHSLTLAALAKLRGSLVGEAYAEAYFCHRCQV